MTSRQRLQATLQHQQPDRVCVDFGATFVTGIHVSALTRLRQAVLGDKDYRVKVTEPYQMLGEVDDQLLEALGIDVIGILPPKSIFGTQPQGWKPFRLFDGTECLVSADFNVSTDTNGDLLIYPQGDTSCAPSGRMPKGGHFFDSIIRQPPVDEDKLDPQDNLEEFGLLTAEDIAYFKQKAAWLDAHRGYGSILIVPGAALGDIALVPAPFLKNPKGIRDVEEWYISTAMRQDYVRAIFEKQCEYALANLETLIGIFGDRVDVALTTGTDFGTQRGLFISLEAYRTLFKPFHKKINDLIHAKSQWKVFIHSCGGIQKLIPDLIEAGFDVLNPVQCSAAGMEADGLKREFGKDITFWGGGVDTQKTLPFGTPDEVYKQVRQRIETFNKDGGFVFNTIHNVQGNTPIDNILAMFKAIKDSGK